MQSFSLAKAAIQTLSERNPLAALCIKVCSKQKVGFAMFIERLKVDLKP